MMRTIQELHGILAEKAASLMSDNSSLEKTVSPGFADKRLYAIYLIETYHYTRHNSRNQAAIAVRPDHIDPRYAKFCLHHAEEEVGHELMALHDLKSLGLRVTASDLPRPLPATEVLIGYLYWTAQNGLPLARLGYSFWAERSYEYIRPLLNFVADGLGLKPSQMTFFNEHSEIDVKHAKEVDAVIERFAKEDGDWLAIEETLVTSLDLTARMLESVVDEFEKLKEGSSSRYAFLNALLEPK